MSMEGSDPLIRSAITQVAADWFAAHRLGPLSETARANFLAWLKASPIHIEEYLAVAAVERTLAGVEADLSVDALLELARNDATGGVMDIASPAARYQAIAPPAPKRFRFGAAAAAAAAACASILGVVAFWTVRDFHGSSTTRTYRTAHGQQGVWPLPDGSTLHVNTDTSVTVRFTPTERLLDVDHGQIAVEVAHDGGRKFRVHAGATDAVAVGTRFDVWRRSDATLISVVAGQIAVSVEGAPAAPHNVMRVQAGQQVRVVGGVLPVAPEPTDLLETTAWLDRKIVFNERPLAAVAEEFNRYNSVTFTIEDQALRNLPISGAFAATDTESFAAFLGSLDGVRVDRQPTGFDVSRHSPDPTI